MATPASAGWWDLAPNPLYSLKEEQQVRWVLAKIGRQVLGSKQAGQAGELGRERLRQSVPRQQSPFALQPQLLPTWAALSSAGSLRSPWAKARTVAAGRSLAWTHGNPCRSEAERLRWGDVVAFH